jgi:hypothetical protein
LLTSRDRRIIRFINDFRLASASQIHTLFFTSLTQRRCQQRLNILTRQRHLSRWRGHINDEYLYFVGKKPKEVEHMLQRVDAYIQLNDRYQLTEFVPEFSFCGIRADAYFEVWQNGYVIPYFLEVQRSPYFNTEKYMRPYLNDSWADRWSVFPEVIIISDLKLRIDQRLPIKFKIFQTNFKIHLTNA